MDDRFAGVPGRGKKPVYPKPRKPAVVLQHKTYQNIKKGTNLVVEAVRPTLGPLPRLVVLERIKREDAPEFLDDGALIGRRIIQIIPRSQDVGAMLIRHALWRMHEEVGDGSATMAVMYQTILNEGIRYITEFGYNAMLLRTGLEKGLKAVREVLHKSAIPLIGKDNIAKIARGMCQEDQEMADILGEIFDIVGTDGLILVEDWNKAGIEREYIEGTYWDISGWFSRHFVIDPVVGRTVFEEAALLITDLELKDPNQLVPVLERCVQAGVKSLVIIAKSLSDSVTGLLVSNNRAKVIQTMAVRTPRVTEKVQVANMEDIAALTGGRIFYSGAKDTLDDFRPEDLGYARRAWATESLFGIYGGKGDPRRIRQQMVNLRGMIKLTEQENEKQMLIKRLGRMSGGTAIFRVGAITDTARETRKGVAERAVTSLRTAIQGGVTPGGGAALLNAQSGLAGLPAENEEETIAYRILARALEEPMRTIVTNAGFQPDVVLDHVKSSPAGYGFDVLTEKITDMKQAGILDSLTVLEKALDIAVSGAAITLTTDVIVHVKEPRESINP